MNAYRIRSLRDAESPHGDASWRCMVERIEGGAAHAQGSLVVAFGIGLAAPRYWFYVGQVAYRADALPLARRDRVLLLGNDYTGARALRTIQLEPDAQPDALEALLLGTLALLPEPEEDLRHPLASRTIVELPGTAPDGRSPFWEGLGARFYTPSLPARDADEREDAEAKVAVLLPRQPVVVSLLAPSAQDAIGVVADSHAHLARALGQCGFRRGLHVNACDGGPVFEAQGGWRATGLPLVHARAEGASERWLVRLPGQDAAWVLPARRAEGALGISEAHAALLGAAPGAPCIASRLPG